MSDNSGCWDDGTDEALFGEAATASPARREAIHQQLVMRHIGLAVSIARRYSGSNFTEDVRQVALIGLVKAVKGYDAERGFPFASFAGPTISGEVKRHFRDQGWLVRPPRSVQENVGVIAGLRETLLQELGYEPTAEDFARKAGLKRGDVQEAIRGERGMYGDPLEIDERIHRATAGLDIAEPVEIRLDLERAMSTLTPQQREIVEMRFVQDWTQREIAEVTGVSQMQISRQITTILRELRSVMEVEAA